MAAADETVTFAIDLESNVPAVSKDSAQAIQELRSKIIGGTDALKELQNAQRRLKGTAYEDQASMKKLSDEILKQKTIIAAAQQGYISLGGTFGKSAQQAAQSSRGWRSILDIVSKAPGPIGEAARKMNLLNDEEFKAKAARVGLKVASLALGAATIYAAKETIAYGLAQADARRSELLRLEGMTKIRKYMAGLYGMGGGMKADSASFLQEQIDKVSGSAAIGRERVAEFAGELYRAGYRGGNLQAALKGISLASSAAGEEGAAAFRQMSGQALLLGGSVKAVTARFERDFGGIVKRQMLSLPVISMKFKESLDHLFDGLKIEGILEGFKMITDLFSQDMASGRALKFLLEDLFGPVGAAAKSAAPIVRAFFEGMIIAALILENKILDLRLYFKKTFGDVSLFKGLDTVKLATYAGALAFGVLAAAIGYAAFALASLLSPALLVIAAIGAIGLVIDQAMKLWREVDWKKLGKDIVLGIGRGIISMQNWVINVMRELGGSIWKKFKESLGISSPSRVMIKAAIEIPKGIAKGISIGAVEVARSMAAVTPELRRMPSVQNVSNIGGPKSISAFEGAEIHVHGVQDPEGFAEALRKQARRDLYSEFAGLASEMGNGKL